MVSPVVLSVWMPVLVVSVKDEDAAMLQSKNIFKSDFEETKASEELSHVKKDCWGLYYSTRKGMDRCPGGKKAKPGGFECFSYQHCADVCCEGNPGTTPTPTPEGHPSPASTTCEAQCVAEGHCCTGSVSSYKHPSCAMGCTIGKYTSNLAACEQVCRDNDNTCFWSIAGIQMKNCEDCPSGCDAQGGIQECLSGCSHAFKEDTATTLEPGATTPPHVWGNDTATTPEPGATTPPHVWGDTGATTPPHAAMLQSKNIFKSDFEETKASEELSHVPKQEPEPEPEGSKNRKKKKRQWKKEKRQWKKEKRQWRKEKRQWKKEKQQWKKKRAALLGQSDEVSVEATEPEAALLEIASSDGEFIALNSSEQQQFLAEHNKYRCMHGAPPLSWHSGMANSAAHWARTCCQGGLQHSGSYRLNPSSGENLAAGPSTIAAAVKNWYDEVKFCTWSTGCAGHGTGHFTAMIWKSTSMLGCARYATGWKGYPVYVCRYALSAPNIGGNYKANVAQKTKQASQCGGGGGGSSRRRRRR